MGKGPRAVAWLLALAALVAAAVLALSLVEPASPGATSAWAPAWAERGGSLELRIELEAPSGASTVHLDLHGVGADRGSLGYVAGAPLQRAVPARAAYVFNLKVPDKPDLASVEPIVYVSGNEGWEGLIEGWRLGAIPLRRAAPAGPAAPFAPASVRPLEPAEVAPRRDSAPLRALAVLAFAAAALLSARVPAAKEREGGERRGILAFALACLAASLCEILPPEDALAPLLRAAAAGADLYWARREPQLALSLLFLGFGALGALVIALRSRRRGLGYALSRTALLAYACLAALRIVSAHDADAILSRSLGGTAVQLGQAARLACAALCLAGAVPGRVRARRELSGGDRGSA